jgi:hypothetical protein
MNWQRGMGTNFHEFFGKSTWNRAAALLCESALFSFPVFRGTGTVPVGDEGLELKRVAKLLCELLCELLCQCCEPFEGRRETLI